MVIGLVHVGLTWDETMVADDLPAGLMPAVLAVSFVLYLSLVLLISRRRNQAAKWVLVVLTLIGLLPFLPIFETDVDWLQNLIEIGMAALQTGGTALLFTRSA